MMSHITHMNTSHYTYKEIMSHTHNTPTHAHASFGIKSRQRLQLTAKSNAAHIHESSHTYEWVMSHI